MPCRKPDHARTIPNTTWPCNGNPDEPQACLPFILAGLLALPREERNAFVEFWQFWRDLGHERRACVVKTIMPDATDDYVAMLSGVKRRTLFNYKTYQKVKGKQRAWKDKDGDKG